MSQVLQKSDAAPGSLVYFGDGTSAAVGVGGTLVVPDAWTLPLINVGWSPAATSQKAVVIPPSSIRSLTGLILTATETAGTFNIAVASEVFKVQGEITDNETEVSVGYAFLALPSGYVAGTDVVVQIPCSIVSTGAAVNNGSTVDLEARVQALIAVGSDLCATAAQTFAALDTVYTKSFTITGTTLLPGDVIVLKLTSSIIDSEAGGGTLRFNMDALKALITTRT